MLCGDCDKAISPSILFYPDEFLMKVTDIQINRTSSSQRPNLPKF